MRDDRQLDLFAWAPIIPPPTPEQAMTIADVAPAGALTIHVFPADRRVGKIRDVATKLMAKTTDRSIEHYRWQVTEALLVNMASRHVPEEQHGEQVRRFWVAVDCEVARRVNGRQRPTGGAA